MPRTSTFPEVGNFVQDPFGRDPKIYFVVDTEPERGTVGVVSPTGDEERPFESRTLDLTFGESLDVLPSGRWPDWSNWIVNTTGISAKEPAELPGLAMTVETFTGHPERPTTDGELVALRLQKAITDQVAYIAGLDQTGPAADALARLLGHVDTEVGRVRTEMGLQ